jgi:RNA 2',3'-cyclic 3'-phosphodiesterase
VRSKRLFIAIDIPNPLARTLGDLDPNLRGVRWLPPEQVHLTLSFLGDVPEDAEARLRENLKAIRFSAFFLPLTGIGAFPGKGRPNVIWIGVGPGHPHLFQLHKRVQDAALAAGLEPDLRPWHPHITLARCREKISRESVSPFLKANVDLDAGMFRVESFALYSSELKPEGSVHTRELVVCA